MGNTATHTESISPSLSRRRGPKPGNPHSGQFRVGHDERRNRISPKKKEFQELCKEQGEKAVETLVEALSDNKAGWKDRLLAAEMLISHGYGKAVDRIQVAQMSGGQGSLKDADMETLMGVLESRAGVLIEGDCYDD